MGGVSHCLNHGLHCQRELPRVDWRDYLAGLPEECPRPNECGTPKNCRERNAEYLRKAWERAVNSRGRK